MDALLLTFLVCLAAETGDRSQRLAHMLAERYGRAGGVLAGAALAAVAGASLSVWLGGMVAGLMGADARHLFMALAFILGGAGMWVPVRTPDSLSGWRLGPIMTSALGIFILGFGEGAQFLIAGIAVARGDPVLAVAGGVLGIFVACLPAAMMGREFYARVPVGVIRKGAGSVFILTGAVVAVMALGLA